MREMPRTVRPLVVIPILCAVALQLFFGEAWTDEKRPWSLRDHYTTTAGNVSFKYARDNAEWTLVDGDGGTLVDTVNASVQLSDGTIINTVEYDDGKAETSKFRDALGAGTSITVTFPPHGGLAFIHRVNIYDERPFMILSVEVRNASQAPVTVANIRPVILGGAGIVDIGKDMAMGRFALVLNDFYGDRFLVHFRIPSLGRSLAMGTLPKGKALSSLDIRRHGTGWNGTIDSQFDPPLRLDPGQTLEGNNVWLSFAPLEPVELEEIFTWTCATLKQTVLSTPPPKCWLTAPGTASAEELYATVRHWKETKIDHVLLPPSWEQPPGSLHGAPPAFPKDLRRVAEALRDLRKIPGITVSPLHADGKAKSWTVRDSQGDYWFNLALPEAKEMAVQRLHKLVNKGFQFFVVQPTNMPDELLEDFHFTRIQADRMAFEIMAQAADGRPVVPFPRKSFSLDAEQWQQALHATQWNYKYRLIAAAVRVDLADANFIEPSLQHAFSSYAGPIQFQGLPGKKAKKELGRLIRTWNGGEDAN